MRTIDELILHCSATPEGRHVTVEDIRRWHLKMGFRDIGYHFVVYLDGSVHQGRHLDQVGAHTTGHNAHSVGVCDIGGLDSNLKPKPKPKDTRTPQQRQAMLNLCRELLERFPQATVHGHNEYAKKACPSFDARQWAKENHLGADMA